MSSVNEGRSTRVLGSSWAANGALGSGPMDSEPKTQMGARPVSEGQLEKVMSLSRSDGGRRGRLASAARPVTDGAYARVIPEARRVGDVAALGCGFSRRRRSSGRWSRVIRFQGFDEAVAIGQRCAIRGCRLHLHQEYHPAVCGHAGQ